MSIQVEEMSQRDDAELISFLDALGSKSPSVLGYHYPFYRDMMMQIGVGRAAYWSARENGKLVGVLPSFVRESSAGAVFCSLPYFGPNAGVICDPERREEEEEIHAALLGALLRRAEESKALSVSVYTPFLFDKFGFYEARMPGAVVIQKSTQYLDLSTAQWSSKINYDLRRAQKMGVSISSEVTAKAIEEFYGLYRQNCQDYSIPLKPREAVEFLFKDGISSGHVSCYFAFLEGKMIGGLMMIWAPHTTSYYIPCTLAEARTIQPGTVLIDCAVGEARRRGIRYWNWESSPSRDSGVYQFKHKWGSSESAYRIYVQPLKPLDTFKALGKEGLAHHFPYFFVFPFDRL